MKAWLAPGLRLLAQPFSLKTLIRWTAQDLLLPVYHLCSKHALPHILPLYSYPGPKRFQKDLDCLLRHFQPISWPTLKHHLDQSIPFSKPVFHLSFDDGLRPIFEEVRPILLEKGIPATFFLNPAFLNNQQLFFRHKAALIIQQLQSFKVAPSQQKALSSLFADRGKTGILPSDYLTIRHHESALLDEAATLLDLSFEDYLLEERPYMNHSEIKTLISDGFSIGAHSVDHPEFRFIPLSDQIDQCLTSHRQLADQYEGISPIFAFPFTDFGVKPAFFEAIYANGMDYSFGCAGVKTDSIRRNLQRFDLEAGTEEALAKLKREYLYTLLRKWLGKHIIHR